MSGYFHGLAFDETMAFATMVNTDPRLEYDLAPVGVAADEDAFHTAALPDGVEWADTDKLDWSVIGPDHDPDHKGTPMSWHGVKTVAAGEEWYRSHTEMPECIIHYLARYHWGDGLVQPPVKHAAPTGKSKRKKKYVGKIGVNKGNYHVSFD